MALPSLRRLAPACLLLAAAVLVGCGGADPRPGSTALSPVVRDSAGVRLVALADVDVPFPDTLREVLRISSADSGTGVFSEVSPSSVATNGVDRIYLLDTRESQIVVFDTTGAALDRWGRKGGGPGEFEYGNGIVVSTDGSVEVFDFMRPAQVRFGSTGEPLAMRQFPRDSSGSPMGVYAARDDVVMFGVRRQSADSVTRTVILAGPNDSAEVASLTVPVTPNVAFESCPLRLRGMEPYFSPPFDAAATARGIALLRSAAWRVEWYEGSALAAVWERGVAPRAASEALLESELEGGLKFRFPGGSCEVPTEEAIRLIGMRDALPALRRLAVAPDGTLWAERFEPRGDSPRVDVVTAEGRYLGTLDGRGAPLGFLSGGRVLYGEEDAVTGLTELVVYRVPGAGW